MLFWFFRRGFLVTLLITPPGAALPKSAEAGPLMTSTRSILANDDCFHKLVWARIPLSKFPELRLPVARKPRIEKSL